MDNPELIYNEWQKDQEVKGRKMFSDPHPSQLSGDQIFRYELAIADYQEISIPNHFEVLSVAPNRKQTVGINFIDLWAKVNRTNPLTALRVYIFGTEHPMPDRPMSFAGTCVMENGLVWHVFYSATR